MPCYATVRDSLLAETAFGAIRPNPLARVSRVRISPGKRVARGIFRRQALPDFPGDDFSGPLPEPDPQAVGQVREFKAGAVARKRSPLRNPN